MLLHSRFSLLARPWPSFAIVPEGRSADAASLAGKGCAGNCRGRPVSPPSQAPGSMRATGGVRAGVRSALPLLEGGGEGRWRCAAKDRAMLLWGCTARNPGLAVTFEQVPLLWCCTVGAHSAGHRRGSPRDGRPRSAHGGSISISISRSSNGIIIDTVIINKISCTDLACIGPGRARSLRQTAGVDGSQRRSDRPGPPTPRGPPPSCARILAHKHGKHDPAIGSPITIHQSIQHSTTQHCLCAESTLGGLTTPPRRRSRCWTPPSRAPWCLASEGFVGVSRQRQRAGIRRRCHQRCGADFTVPNACGGVQSNSDSKGHGALRSGSPPGHKFCQSA